MVKACPIHYFAEDIAFVLPHTQLTSAWIQSAIVQENYQLGYINFIFCSDAFLHAKNLEYLQHNTLTDVITFDYADKPKLIQGDIYISIDRVKENAITYQNTFEKELYIVMIHGVLHLLGYADQDAVDQEKMRQKEALYVANLMSEAHLPS